jgi:ubiquinone/menaquinone biosynthesis C-methylase UbiE/glycosyltransferase involved in cell wall biosynthesis
MKVSILLPACNQGKELALTIESAKDAIGDLPHEIIVVDDQSVDGCTRDLPRDVLILRPPKRLGVTGARRVLQATATGDIIVWSDTHCRYPVDGLKKMCLMAEETGAVIIPLIISDAPESVPSIGGGYSINERGITLPKMTRRVHPKHPSLVGAVYAARKDVWDKVDGWPLLPGYWGCADTVLSIMTWCAGVKHIVATDIQCVHKYIGDNRRFRFSTVYWHHAANAHWLHKALFPNSYPTYWRPLLLKHAKWCDPKVMKRVDASLASKEFKALAAFVVKIRLPERTEAECFKQLLGMIPPECAMNPNVEDVDAASKVAGPVGDEHYAAYVAKQAEIAPGREHIFIRSERVDALNWLAEQDTIKLGDVLDVGPRDGYIMALLKEKGANTVRGLEVSPPAVAFLKTHGFDVAEGDVRQMPFADASFDLITCLHVLEHVPEPDKAMREMWRVLRPNGWLFVVVPRQQGVNGQRRGAHYSYFDRERALTGLAKSCGIDGTMKIATGVIKNRVRELRLAVHKVPKNDPVTGQSHIVLKTGAEKTAEREEAFAWLAAQNGVAEVKDALDVGCGDGVGMRLIEKHYPGVHVRGVDLVPERVESAKKHGLDVTQGDLSKLICLFPCPEFDLVTSLHVLEHVVNPLFALESVYEVLNPGGRIFVIVPRESKPKHKAHLCCFPRERVLIDMVKMAGFTDIQTQTAIIHDRIREIRLTARKA